MSEEVTIGDCRLILGDCREVLPTLPMVDLVLTDPPYGLGKRMQGGTWGGAQKYKDLVIWDSRPADDLLLVLAKRAKKAVFWGGNYFALPPSRCWLVWDKLNGDNDFADCELAWTNLQKAVRRIQFRWKWNDPPAWRATRRPSDTKANRRHALVPVSPSRRR